MFKTLEIICALVVVILAPGARTTNEKTSNLQLAFHELDSYLARDGQAGLEGAARGSKWLFGRQTNVQRAAKYLLYLQEFDSCSPKAIDYIDYTMRGRPSGRPSRPTSGASKLDQVVRASLVGALAKCKSYFELWTKESEHSIESTIRHLLYDWLTRDDHQTIFDVSEMVANVTMEDNFSSKGQLISMQNEHKLYKFYKNYIWNKYIGACKSYVASMWPLMDRAARLGVGYSSRLAGYFDEPTRGFFDCRRRFDRCKLVLELRAPFVEGSARAAAKRVLDASRLADH